MSDPNNPSSKKFGFEEPQKQIDVVDFVVHDEQKHLPEATKPLVEIRRNNTDLEKVCSVPVETGKASPATDVAKSYNEVAIASVVGTILNLVLAVQSDNQFFLLLNFLLLLFAVSRLFEVIGQSTGPVIRAQSLRSMWCVVFAFVSPIAVVALLANFPQILQWLVSTFPFINLARDGGEQVLKWAAVVPFVLLGSLWLFELTVLINVNQPESEVPTSKLFFPFLLMIGTVMSFCGGILWRCGIITLLNLGFGFDFICLLVICDSLKGIKPDKLKTRATRMSQPKALKSAASK